MPMDDSDALELLRQHPLPFAKLLGIEILSASRERVTAELLVRDEICTRPAILHGGALMAFADTLGAVAAFLNLPPGASTTTLESKTNFLGAAPAGTKIIGECTPIHRGRTTQVWQTQITSQAGKMIGLVTQTQMVLEGK